MQIAVSVKYNTDIALYTGTATACDAFIEKLASTTIPFIRNKGHSLLINNDGSQRTIVPRPAPPWVRPSWIPSYDDCDQDEVEN